mmetsp:Transcript_15948/g.30081  ORF Transcript_15948/g.30081 Transcript_15948/m.30081 type:complete len:322 (+) Transcript_15948:146-1111(+)
MKVFLHYEDNKDSNLHKSLKITLPKKWLQGPTFKLLEFGIESYNASDLGKTNPLVPSEMHLALKISSQNDHQDSNNNNNNNNDEGILTPLASDAIITNVLDDRDAVYMVHGPSKTLEEIQQEKQEEINRKKEEMANTVQCVHFGCKNRWIKGTPPPKCCYHASPPVFHETAKFWSCCPQKKAYDWDEFQAIPGCQTGICTNVKEENGGKQFLGGCDLREAVGEAQKLKSIEDFNASMAAGGSSAAPILERLRSVMAEIGVEEELFDQVLEGIKKEVGDGHHDDRGEKGVQDGDELGLATRELGAKLKKAMKAIAVEQLRIK